MGESSHVRMDYCKISGISLWKSLYWGAPYKIFEGNDLTVGFQYLKGGCKEDEGGVVTTAWSHRTRGNGFSVKEIRH